ncbi:IscS subfamily cysteine desulfurase [Flavilitoribacter nigricans]|uniref:Cysteine desulfurase IscS n=1 Tax=Flavilitoribacter nigricans (strain ATCC 23147 / DSM 23189 / NBRC 102662 / NCIMB 1420 / SS-2) TaxID=1122177 RepID=A0A2D0N9H4_FLAN2|nr:IscS subfamily cysteine desulfurase [Flavilitoribacter nigricans]PHN05030.1 IscS subfamily cysteine desulfurase [Flavilitoribacter nigricans DSM 23189 = NBRC 102662]
MQQLIYLDYNATTPVDPQVVEAMLPYFYEKPGNAASRTHPFGWVADEAVDQARQQIAGLIQADPREVVFTSGATEADNLAIKGVFQLYQRKGQHIITVKTEHKAVLDTTGYLEKLGAEITYLDVDADGLIDLEELEAAIRPDTILVSVMWANNETGVIQPMAEIGEICTRKGVLLMSDATQAVGKIPVNPRETGIHIMTFSAHKMYGPKGIGGLYVSRQRPRVKLAAQIHGGGHEQGMRSGTLNVPAVVGFGKAAEIAGSVMAEESRRLAGLRDRLEQSLQQELEAVKINGSREHRLSHVSNLSFRHVDAEALISSFNRSIAVATGSACSSASLEPSHVLQAMGLAEEWLKGSIRFSFGRFSEARDVDRTVELIVKGVQALRAESPVWEMFKEGII